MNDETVSEEDLSFNDVYYIPATGGIHIEQHFGTILLSNTNTGVGPSIASGSQV